MMGPGIKSPKGSFFGDISTDDYLSSFRNTNRFSKNSAVTSSHSIQRPGKLFKAFECAFKDL